MKEKKPPSRRTNAKEEVERIAKLFECIIDKQITFSFGKFSFPIVIQEIKLAKTSKSTPGGMKNPPKMIDSDEGRYTPPVIQFNTSSGKLYFILESIQVVAIANGVRIITAANNIDFRAE